MQQAERKKRNLFSLVAKDKAALYKSYMPFIKLGGLFIPTSEEYQLDDEVFLLLYLHDDKSVSETVATCGRVVWKTPPGASLFGPAGIGIQFTGGGKAMAAVERFLGEDWLNSDKKTHTL